MVVYQKVNTTGSSCDHLSHLHVGHNRQRRRRVREHVVTRMDGPPLFIITRMPHNNYQVPANEIDVQTNSSRQITLLTSVEVGNQRQHEERIWLVADRMLTEDD